MKEETNEGRLRAECTHLAGPPIELKNGAERCADCGLVTVSESAIAALVARYQAALLQSIGEENPAHMHLVRHAVETAVWDVTHEEEEGVTFSDRTAYYVRMFARELNGAAAIVTGREAE